MEPEIVLVVVFSIAVFRIKIVRKQYEFARPGRIAMSAMLVVTAIGHFMFTRGMSMMLPDFIPFRVVLVYLTGMIEIAAAMGLCFARFRVRAAWLLIVFFVLLLPANIYEAVKHVNIETARFDGNGPDYLFFRVPLQLLFIGWVYLSSIKKPAEKKPAIVNNIKHQAL